MARHFLFLSGDGDSTSSIDTSSSGSMWTNFYPDFSINPPSHPDFSINPPPTLISQLTPPPTLISQLTPPPTKRKDSVSNTHKNSWDPGIGIFKISITTSSWKIFLKQKYLRFSGSDIVRPPPRKFEKHDFFGDRYFRIVKPRDPCITLYQ